MGVFITNNIEQECFNLISMYTDICYVNNRILKSYPHLSSEKQPIVTKQIKSYIDQANSFFEKTDDNILTAPLTIFYALQNYAKAIFLVNYPNLSLTGSHGIEFNNDVAKNSNEIGDITCKITKKGTFNNLITVTGDDLCEGDVITMKDIFSIIPELRETYYLRYFNEPNIYLLKQKKHCTSEYEVVFQDNDINNISNRDFSILDNNSIHMTFMDSKAYVWKDSNYLEENGKKVMYKDIYGNLYCTNSIQVNGKVVKISKLASLYLCYYVFSMLVRYYPDKWKIFCESSDVAIIKKILINCRREMLAEVIQLLSGEEYFFTTVMEEKDAELDAGEVYKLVKEEARKEFKRTGENAFIF